MTQQQRLKELKKYGNTPSRQGRATPFTKRGNMSRFSGILPIFPELGTFLPHKVGTFLC